MIKVLTSGKSVGPYRLWLAFGPPRIQKCVNVTSSMSNEEDARERYEAVYRMPPQDVILVEYP